MPTASPPLAHHGTETVRTTANDRMASGSPRLFTATSLRGTGILNNSRYIGRIEWGRTRWKRGHANSLKRNADPERSRRIHVYIDESQRIIPQELWEAVKTRQSRIHKRQRNAPCRTTQRNEADPRNTYSPACCAAPPAAAAFSVVDCPQGLACMTAQEWRTVCMLERARIRRDELEQRIVALIRDELLCEEAVKLAASEFRRVVREARKAAPSAPVTDQAHRRQGSRDRGTARPDAQRGTVSDSGAGCDRHEPIEERCCRCLRPASKRTVDRRIAL